MARAFKFAALTGAGLLLVGCQNFNEALGTAKQAPDEFTVVTKAPLILPPDYNLRPPQPGAADRNQGDADDEARAALFATQDPQTAAAALGPTYSDAEKALLAKSGGVNADPAIRQQISTDSGLTDQGDAYAQKVLYPQGTAAPAPAQPQPQGAAAPVPPAQVRGTTAQ